MGTRRDEQIEATPEDDEDRAGELAAEVAEGYADPTTRREAIEQALEDEDLSEEGEVVGDDID